MGAHLFGWPATTTASLPPFRYCFCYLRMWFYYVKCLSAIYICFGSCLASVVLVSRWEMPGPTNLFLPDSDFIAFVTMLSKFILSWHHCLKWYMGRLSVTTSVLMRWIDVCFRALGIDLAWIDCGKGKCYFKLNFPWYHVNILTLQNELLQIQLVSRIYYGTANQWCIQLIINFFCRICCLCPKYHIWIPALL